MRSRRVPCANARMETETRHEFRARRLRERRQRVILLGLLLGAGLLAYGLTLTTGERRATPESQVREGLHLAAPIQRAVADYVRQQRAYPADSEAIGLAAADIPRSGHIESVTIDQGFIVISFSSTAHPRLRGKQLKLIPDVRSDGSLAWGCDPSGFDSEDLPPQCERARQRVP